MFLYRLAKICAEGRLILPFAQLLNQMLLGIVSNKNSVCNETDGILNTRD